MFDFSVPCKKSLLVVFDIGHLAISLDVLVTCPFSNPFPVMRDANPYRFLQRRNSSTCQADPYCETESFSTHKKF
jgi:hypothetical protein